MSTLDDMMAIVGDAIAEDHDVPGWLSTGSPVLNKRLSGRYDGGIGYGRLYEIYGPSSSGKTVIAANLMIEAQKAGGSVILVDFEQAFMVEMSIRNGLKPAPPYFIHMKPMTWEEGMMKALKLGELMRAKKTVPPEAPILVVVDSIAAGVPQSVMAKELTEMTMNDSTALARATSNTLRVIAPRSKSMVLTWLFLNQVREKPGVCLRYDANVRLADGTYEGIGKLVHAREPVEVATLNLETGQVESAPIAQFHRTPHDGRWVHVVTTGGKNGRRSAFFTEDHLIKTPGGWSRAGDLKVDDEITTVAKRYYTDEQHQIILASLLGDGQILFGDGKNARSTKGRLRLVHGKKQAPYLAWKAALLGIQEPQFTSLHCYADSRSSMELGRYRGIQKFKALLSVPEDYIQQITPLVGAIWFMDDGTYTAKHGGIKYGEGRYSIAAATQLPIEQLERIAAHFASIGMGHPRATLGKGLIWTGEDAKLFGEAIAPLVPSCMGYKLNRKLTAGGDLLTVERTDPYLAQYTDRVTSVRTVTDGGSKGRYKYDIGIDGTHNFVVGGGGGIVVHNSYGDPTTTPGGKSMEFYASGRLAIGRTRIMEKNEFGDKEMAGQLIGIRCVKSKHTRPFGETDLYFMFDDMGSGYFDMTRSLVKHLAKEGKIAKSGNYLLWTDGKKYYEKQLAERIDREGLHAELKKLLMT